MNDMEINAVSIVAVILTSASPIGEILVAIPTGVALGMDPALAFIVTYPANLLPIIILLPLLDYFERRFPRFFNYFAKEGGRFRKRLEGKYGYIIMVLITPLIGVYATSVSSKFLKFSKKNSFILQSLSLAIYGIVETLGLYFGLQLIPAL